MSVRDYVRRLRGLRGSFRRTFLGPNGRPKDHDAEAVLAELKRFCYGGRPTLKGSPAGLDVHASVAAAARQEVWFRIQGMLNLDDSDLAVMEKRAEMTTDE